MIDWAARGICEWRDSKCHRCPHAKGDDDCYKGFAGPDEDCDWEEPEDDQAQP